MSLRLDLFLKWCRIIPRRSVSRAACDAGCVEVNGQVARASRVVKPEDVVHVALPNREMTVRILFIPSVSPSSAAAAGMIEVLESKRRRESSI